MSKIKQSTVKKLRQALKEAVKKNNQVKHAPVFVETDEKGTHITIPSGDFLRYLEEVAQAKMGGNTNGVNQAENGDSVEIGDLAKTKDVTEEIEA